MASFSHAHEKSLPRLLLLWLFIRPCIRDIGADLKLTYGLKLNSANEQVAHRYILKAIMHYDSKPRQYSLSVGMHATGELA